VSTISVNDILPNKEGKGCMEEDGSRGFKALRFSDDRRWWLEAREVYRH